ncbi:hypothetical protein [Pseudonocardia alni]|uniref:hypothetical protein n=1 Tax=Pseudonocardia alni TaxID=33907 RepID=UPI003328EA3A
MRRVALVLLGCLVSAGCSQIDAIAPVGGNRLAEVRFAAADLLVRDGIALLAGPACTTAADGSVGCTGRTVDGRPVTVAAPGTGPVRMTLRVGDTTVHDGPVQEVLDAAARPAR